MAEFNPGGAANLNEATKLRLLANADTNVLTNAQLAALNAAAPKASPALTGSPTTPTAPPGSNTTQIANTAFVQAAVALLVASAPGTLDTLNELAAALGNDANFSATVTAALAAKAPLSSPNLVGTPSAPTAALATNTTQIATTAFVQAVAGAGLPDSPALTGTPTAPTAAPGTNTTQIANTAFVQAAVGAGIPASPALTGIPTTPNAALGTNTTQIANTAFVQAAIGALVDSAPAALNTLNELAAAIGDDANFAGTVTTALAGKQATHANLTAFAGLSLIADRLPYANGTGTLALATLTAAGRALIDDADASTQLSTLGVSTFVKTILDDANAAAVLTTLGISAFAQTILDDADAAAAQTTLGISTFVKTLLDDANAAAVQTTLGITAFAQTLLDDADAATVRATLGVGTAQSPQFTGIELGAATDTTLARAAAGRMTIEGAEAVRSSTTQGGTGCAVVQNVVSCTTAEYAALTKDATTFYIIED